MINLEIRDSVEKLFYGLRDGSIDDVEKCLSNIDQSFSFKNRYLSTLSSAIREDDYSKLTNHFLDEDFISEEGIVLMISPYKVYRSKREIILLTGVFGVAIFVDNQDESTVEYPKHLRAFALPKPRIIGFRRISSFGVAGGASGEAFLVPGSWCIPDSTLGPALNDLTEQYARINIAAICIRTIFDKESSEIILSPILNPIDGITIRHKEFLFHDAGHMTGLGLKRKISSGFFKNHHNRGVEEWRSDGVSFYFMSKELNRKEASKLAAATIALRFGLDAHRPGGYSSDPDVFATLLMFKNLVEVNAFLIRKNKLSFNFNDFDYFIDMLQNQCEKALELTSIESSVQLEEIYQSYRSIAVDKKVIKLFEKNVTSPCKNMLRTLM
jgi:hypothetical protein